MTGVARCAAVVNVASAAAGLGASGAEPIRFGENAIFRLPGPVVARNARPGRQPAARCEVARWLNTSGIIAVAPLAAAPQPVEVNGRSAARRVARWKDGTATRSKTRCVRPQHGSR